MATIRSTTYCDSPRCTGHVRVSDHPGMSLVLTDDPAQPFALVPSA